MGSPYQIAIRGRLVVIGKEPDGDSVGFRPDDPGNLGLLARSYRIHPSPDGAVQLRFEAVDAPELHYGTAAQPCGATSRDALLRWIGFTSVDYEDSRPNRVAMSTPDAVPAVVFSVAADPHGRPVSYVLVDAGEWPEDGAWTYVDEQLLARTLNARLLGDGMAYPTFYTSTPEQHRRQLRDLARDARDATRGVWKADDTADFQLVDQASIGPDGQLILPKLFRRATDYLKDMARGFRGNLSDWLVANAATPSRQENDVVVVGDRVEVPLSALLEQQNARVRLQPDLFDIVFVEK